MRHLVATILLLIFAVGVLGVVIYSFFLVDSRPYPPVIFSYSDDYWKGLFAFGFAASNDSTQEVIDQYLVVMDPKGAYLGILNSSTHSFNYINQLSDSELYYYYRPQRGLREQNASLVAEARIWNYRSGDIKTILEGVDIRGHHEFLIEDGYFVTMRRVGEGGLDTIVHLDPDTGTETWLWSSEPYFPKKVCSLCRDDDWTHGNDVTLSLDGRFYYVNFRNTDNFAKVEIETGNLVWFAGRNGNFTLIEDGIKKESLWYHSHIVKEVEPNVFIMFDNDFHNITKLNDYPSGENPYITNYGGQSRLIEFKIDEATMTGEITWSYAPPEEYFSAIFGDIDLLPNGNIIGTFGTPNHQWTKNHEEIEQPFGAALLEVNRAGELIREYRFPLGVSIYRVLELSEDTNNYVGSWLLDYD